MKKKNVACINETENIYVYICHQIYTVDIHLIKPYNMVTHLLGLLRDSHDNLFYRIVLRGPMKKINLPIKEKESYKLVGIGIQDSK